MLAVVVVELELELGLSYRFRTAPRSYVCRFRYRFRRWSTYGNTDLVRVLYG